MKKLILAIFVSFYGMVFSAPQFVTPAMIRRNGLTDEQYEKLWSMGKHPKIDIAAARDWIFRASRYTNVVDWLAICGRTNDFAKLSHKLQGDNFTLEETNKLVRADNRRLVSSNVVLEVSLEYAEIDANKARKVQKEAEKARKKDAKTFEKWVKDTQKAKSKSSEEMAAFYDAILTLADEAEVN